MKNVIMTIAAIIAVTVLSAGSILPAPDYTHAPRIPVKDELHQTGLGMQ